MPDEAVGNLATVPAAAPAVPSLTGRPGTVTYPVGDLLWYHTHIPLEEREELARCGEDRSTWTDDDEETLQGILDHHRITEEYDIIGNWHRGHHRAEPNVMWTYLRREARLTMRAAAETVGVNPSSISRWEANKREPSTHDAGDYRKFLDTCRREALAIRRSQILVLSSIRDLWPHFPTGQELAALWDEMWRLGGMYDQWKRTTIWPNTNRFGAVNEQMAAARADAN